MRTAIFIADGKPLTGKVDVEQAKALFKSAVLNPSHHKHNEVEIWLSDSGRAKYHRFKASITATEPAPINPSVADGTPSQHKDKSKRGGR